MIITSLKLSHIHRYYQYFSVAYIFIVASVFGFNITATEHLLIRHVLWRIATRVFHPSDMKINLLY